MALRDISPAQFSAPGIARISFDLLLTALNQDALNLDTWLSQFSPTSVQTVTLASGANTFTVPSTDVRFLLIVAPFANTSTIIVFYTVTDVGHYMNPNGFYLTTFDPNHMPTTLRLQAGAQIEGVTLMWF